MGPRSQECLLRTTGPSRQRDLLGRSRPEQMGATVRRSSVGTLWQAPCPSVHLDARAVSTGRDMGQRSVSVDEPLVAPFPSRGRGHDHSAGAAGIDGGVLRDAAGVAAGIGRSPTREERVSGPNRAVRHAGAERQSRGQERSQGLHRGGGSHHRVAAQRHLSGGAPQRQGDMGARERQDPQELRTLSRGRPREGGDEPVRPDQGPHHLSPQVGAFFGKKHRCSQKVRHGGAPLLALVLLLHLAEDAELAVQLAVQHQNGGHVAAAITIVGCRPHRHQRLVLEHVLVSLLYKLVGATDQLQPVDVIELAGDARAEQPPCAAGADGPRLDVLRVTPHEVAVRAFVGYLLSSVDGADLVQRANVRRQPAVHAEDARVDQRGHRKIVEQVGAPLPSVGRAVLAQTLVVETVHLGDLARLVVAAQQGDARRISCLETEQKGERLERVAAAIHKVAHEDVRGGRHVAAGAEQFEEVVELAMNVAADGYRRGDRLHVALVDEQLLDVVAEFFEVGFGKECGGERKGSREAVAKWRAREGIAGSVVHWQSDSGVARCDKGSAKWMSPNQVPRGRMARKAIRWGVWSEGELRGREKRLGRSQKRVGGK
eukprot:ctg_660.g351